MVLTCTHNQCVGQNLAKLDIHADLKYMIIDDDLIDQLSIVYEDS